MAQIALSLWFLLAITTAVAVNGQSTDAGTTTSVLATTTGAVTTTTASPTTPAPTHYSYWCVASPSLSQQNGTFTMSTADNVSSGSEYSYCGLTPIGSRVKRLMFRIGDGQRIQFTATVTGIDGFEPVMYFGEGCDASYHDLACSTTNFSTLVSTGYGRGYGLTYYLVIGGRGSSTGSFRLDVQLNILPCFYHFYWCPDSTTTAASAAVVSTSLSTTGSLTTTAPAPTATTALVNRLTKLSGGSFVLQAYTSQCFVGAATGLVKVTNGACQQDGVFASFRLQHYYDAANVTQSANPYLFSYERFSDTTCGTVTSNTTHVCNTTNGVCLGDGKTSFFCPETSVTTIAPPFGTTQSSAPTTTVIPKTSGTSQGAFGLVQFALLAAVLLQSFM